MSDAFSRRGFTRTMLAGAASLWLPSIGRAQPRLTGRLVARGGERLTAELFVTHSGSESIELLVGATHLEVKLRIGEQQHAIRLTPERVQMRPRSRAGFRLGRRMVLPPRTEMLYERYLGTWPQGVTASSAQTASLTFRCVLDVDPGSRPADRAGLVALSAITGRARIT